MKTKLKGVCIGAGYFSQFHYDAWQRIPEVNITALCDHDKKKAEATARKFGIPKVYQDYREMLAAEQVDFVDVITPPNTHLDICKTAFSEKKHVICQKPLAPTSDEARQLVAMAEEAGVRFMVHENFRFQPWHREIKKLLDTEVIGDQIHSLNFRSRMGDGWGADAYLDRQPYFRTMPRMLVYENGVHYIDTFRYLGGEISSVFASLRRLNPVIKGEDAAIIFFDFTQGAQGLWDANRYNESNHENPRYTFGEFLVEGNGGSIRLYQDGRLTIQSLGEKEQEHVYEHSHHGFAGDCCFATQQHFVHALLHHLPFETDGKDYLKTLRVQEAVYQSSKQKNSIHFHNT
ncbi:putative dehydrogenase [Catalinimonas alkaloidigena]|uniref:Gfo/Idh/MocA family protein n=1 Tax=Catalinimonas alkaloidigena TaxID=1075417 RepID=UPI002407215F|nr:Gfo/Idh/MocA family oxidoreductase [Catalinimonas alkaloidigena]MDF9797920.1 putative dehydrogenase [Catalinimonas alkaloidigena]